MLDNVPFAEEYDATQTAILDATVACAIHYGFVGVTTRRIAEIADVNEVTIFRRFGNKTELLKAAFKREANHVWVEGVQYTGNLEADLQTITDALWNAANRRQAVIPLLLSELPRNPELREAAQQIEHVIVQITDILHKYQEVGQLRPEPPIIAFAALIGPIMFITLARQAMPSVDAQIQSHDFVRNFLVGSIVPVEKS